MDDAYGRGRPVSGGPPGIGIGIYIYIYKYY